MEVISQQNNTSINNDNILIKEFNYDNINKPIINKINKYYECEKNDIEKDNNETELNNIIIELELLLNTNDNKTIKYNNVNDYNIDDFNIDDFNIDDFNIDDYNIDDYNIEINNDKYLCNICNTPDLYITASTCIECNKEICGSDKCCIYFPTIDNKRIYICKKCANLIISKLYPIPYITNEMLIIQHSLLKKYI